MTDQLSRVFAALADPTRRDMVARLTEGDHTVNDLAAPYDVSLQAVSKHLKVLEDAGLVTRTREAQRRPVHLEAEVFDLMTKWIERYRRQAEERFARLDAVLARMQETTTRAPPNRRKEPHHDHHADHRRDHPLPRGRDRGRRARARHPHLARLRGHPRAAVPGAHRPRALRAVDRPRATSAPTSPTGRPATAAAGATPRAAATDARSSRPPSAGASTPCARTASCRRSPGRACPTASRWRR